MEIGPVGGRPFLFVRPPLPARVAVAGNFRLPADARKNQVEPRSAGPPSCIVVHFLPAREEWTSVFLLLDTKSSGQMILTRLHVKHTDETTRHPSSAPTLQKISTSSMSLSALMSSSADHHAKAFLSREKWIRRIFEASFFGLIWMQSNEFSHRLLFVKTSKL